MTDSTTSAASAAKLEKQLRVLQRKLERSEWHRVDLENQHDRDQHLYRRLQADLEAAQREAQIQLALERGLEAVGDPAEAPVRREHLEGGRELLQVPEHRFGLATIREGQPVALLEEALVPLYLRHRYQVDATVKLLGGVSYSYAVRGDAQPLPSPVPAAAQHAALDALLDAVSPEVLMLPENLRTQLPPRPPGYGPNRELFDGHTGLTFDPYGPAEVAAGMVLGLLVHPERAARLAYQEDFDPDLPGLTDVLTLATDRIWGGIPDDAYAAELQRLVQQVWVETLIEVSARDDVAPAVAARTTQKLRDLHTWLQNNFDQRDRPRNVQEAIRSIMEGDERVRDPETFAHRTYVFDQIDRYLFRIYNPSEQRATPTTPPGSPIGQDAPSYLIRHQQRVAYLERWMPEPRCMVR